MSSTPSIGVPTLPGRIAPGRTVVAMQLVSDIPHTSQISMPSAAKKSRTSSGVGAAPVTNHSTSSKPSLARTAGPAAGSAVTPPACRAALSFSQTRGTAPKTVGRTCAATGMTSARLETQVTVAP